MAEPCGTAHDPPGQIDLDEITQKAHKLLQEAIVKSNKLPRDLSWKLYASHRHFRNATDQVSKNTIVLSNYLINHDYPKQANFKNGEIENNLEKLMDINNDELDKVKLKIEKVKNGDNHTNEQIFNKPIVNPFMTFRRNNTLSLLPDSNTVMPQINFKDKIDNTNSLWQPIIKYKPNNIQPLQVQLEVDDDGNDLGYTHPYQIELDLYEPPKHFLEEDDQPLEFPPPIESTKFTYVDTIKQLQNLVDELHLADEIAVDLEHHSYYSYQGYTCLVQISIANQDFVIDALKLREHLHLLNESFTNPKKLKVFHGACNDIRWLQRDFGVYVVGMFDTYEASLVLNFKGKKLLDLLKRFCNVETDKRYQMADWQIRPLPSEMILYARRDTHYLIYIWREMKKLLLRDPNGMNLRQVFENSKRICLYKYMKPKFTQSSYLELYNRSNKTFNSRQLAAFKLLFKWRDNQARTADRSVEYIMNNSILFKLSEELPGDTETALRCCQGANPTLKNHLVMILPILISCRDLPLEPTLYHTPASIMSALEHVEQENQSEMLHAFSSDVTKQEESLTTLAPYVPTPDILASISSTLAQNIYRRRFLPPYERYKFYRNLLRKEYFGKLINYIQGSDQSTDQPAKSNKEDAAYKVNSEPYLQLKLTNPASNDNGEGPSCSGIRNQQANVTGN
ncbi:exosome component 10 [Pieris napi]|uniref:exosome component 10 n=1 Tax=Pieris napi TaxID=78633 RepID=UPI001FBA47B0|nr:exosome component 10 [Pieris napi]